MDVKNVEFKKGNKNLRNQMKWKKYAFNTPAQDTPSAAAPAEKIAASITWNGKKNWSTTSADREMVLYCLRR